MIIFTSNKPKMWDQKHSTFHFKKKSTEGRDDDRKEKYTDNIYRDRQTDRQRGRERQRVIIMQETIDVHSNV